MGIPVFLTIILVGVFIMHMTSSDAQKRDRKKVKEFLKEQSAVYIVSKEKLKQIKFEKVDLSNIHFNLSENNNNNENDNNKKTINVNALNSKIDELINLSHKDMTNFKGISNDELKKTYGTNNFDVVMEYQNNFDTFLEKLLSLSEDLEGIDDYSAIKLLELSISLGNDVTKNFTMLADLYCKHSMRKDLYKLVDMIKVNKNLSQNKIMSHIKMLNCAKEKGVD